MLERLCTFIIYIYYAVKITRCRIDLFEYMQKVNMQEEVDRLLMVQ